MIAAINALQVASGLGIQVLEVTSTPLKHVGEGWLINLRDMLRDINAGIWVEKAWRPQQQRQHDMAIMDAFASDPDITPLMMILYMCQSWLMWKAQPSHLTRSRTQASGEQYQPTTSNGQTQYNPQRNTKQHSGNACE